MRSLVEFLEPVAMCCYGQRELSAMTSKWKNFISSYLQNPPCDVFQILLINFPEYELNSLLQLLEDTRLVLQQLMNKVWNSH